MAKFEAGDKAYMVSSASTVIEGNVRRAMRDSYVFAYPAYDGQLGAIRVSGTRLYKSRDEAQAAIDAKKPRVRYREDW